MNEHTETMVVAEDEIVLSERLELIRQAQTDVDSAKRIWNEAKESASDARKSYDGRVETLGAIIRRLTQVPAPLPLFEVDVIAEEPDA